MQNLCPCRLTIELNFQCVLMCQERGAGEVESTRRRQRRGQESLRHGEHITHYTGRLSAVITVIFGKCSSRLTHTHTLSLSPWPGLAVAHQNPLTQYVSAKEEEVLAPFSSPCLCLLPNIYVLIYMRTHVLYHQIHVCVCQCVCVLWHIL